MPNKVVFFFFFGDWIGSEEVSVFLVADVFVHIVHSVCSLYLLFVFTMHICMWFV